MTQIRHFWSFFLELVDRWILGFSLGALNQPHFQNLKYSHTLLFCSFLEFTITHVFGAAVIFLNMVSAKSIFSQMLSMLFRIPPKFVHYRHGQTSAVVRISIQLLLEGCNSRVNNMKSYIFDKIVPVIESLVFLIFLSYTHLIL